MNSLDTFSIRDLALPEKLFSPVGRLIANTSVSLERLDLRTEPVTSRQSEDCWSEEHKFSLLELMPNAFGGPGIQSDPERHSRLRRLLTGR